MSHGINKPWDKVLSIDPCWHGLETRKERITRETVQAEGLFFDLLQQEIINYAGNPLSVSDENAETETARSIMEKIASLMSKGGDLKAMKEARELFALFSKGMSFSDKHKTISADLRGIRPDLEELGEDLIVPLHIPKKSYFPITNARAFDTVMEAMPTATIATVGTLEKLAIFFMSVEIGEELRKGPRGDDFKAHLNVLTSHNGLYGFKIHDAMTRQVCHNTVKMSLGERQAANIIATVYHTRNAEQAMQGVTANLVEVFAGRARYMDLMHALDTLEIGREGAKYLFTYFLANNGRTGDTPEADSISTQVYNKADELAILFKSGMGNAGQTLYDFYNGATELYSWGSGTGKATSKQDKVLKSQFGAAADIKESFHNFMVALMGADDVTSAMQVLCEKGERLYKDHEA